MTMELEAFGIVSFLCVNCGCNPLSAAGADMKQGREDKIAQLKQFSGPGQTKVKIMPGMLIFSKEADVTSCY
jgi:hypothetical protein